MTTSASSDMLALAHKLYKKSWAGSFARPEQMTMRGIEQPVFASRWLMLAALVTACAGTTASPSGLDVASAAQTDVAVMEGVEFTLRVGAAGRLTTPPLLLRLERVESDSRCPVDTTCFWAGDAAVRLSLEAPNARQSAVLHTNPEFERAVTFQGRRVSLVKLMPLPRDGKHIQQVEYEASFLVVAS